MLLTEKKTENSKFRQKPNAGRGRQVRCKSTERGPGLRGVQKSEPRLRGGRQRGPGPGTSDGSSGGSNAASDEG